MFKIRGLLVVGLILSFGAPALAANPYNGAWKLFFDTKTEDLEGTVVVKDDGGTWHVEAKSKKNPCIGSESPIAVKTASETELVFEVQRSKLLASCKDWTVKLKRVDDKTLKGHFADNREIMLQKQ
ncbi:MAG TPA: hypothetical protein VGQ91_16815 [Ideonella sp.]|jgi:hypothetical protein|nr:hypothetical protein [Ideonella sp.]